MKSRLLLPIICLFFITSCSTNKEISSSVLLCIHSGSSEVTKAREFLIPYLDHFGMPYHILDFAESGLPEEIPDDALMIIGHPGITAELGKDHLISWVYLLASKGTGIVTFDTELFLSDKMSDTSAGISYVTFTDTHHFITSSHPENDTLKFYNNLKLTVPGNIDGISLVQGNGNPLLIIKETDSLKLAVWTSMDWMHSDIFGPMRGLDDCLWKSFVWTARKPFIMHALPPVVTMRVDDVAGRGGLWDESPLYWVKTANKYGFMPWLGLFIYNLNPQAIDELRSYLISHQATAFPHAFGRPNREDNRMESYSSLNPIDTVPFYYYPDAIPYRADTYDEFIYYDHQNAKPWTDEEALRGLNGVESWYNAHQPLPVSSCLIPHWYEMGTNCAHFIKEKWRSEFSCFAKPPDKPYADSVQWLVAGPFRKYEKPGSSTAWTRPGGQRPVYYADFLKIADETFFNCLTEIRDDSGYEWAPDNDVEATIGRGVRQLERAMNSLALAVLFTHETDYIYRINPANWDQEMKGISEGIAEYQPRYMLLDDAIRLVRTYHTSRTESILYYPEKNIVKIDFTGSTDVSSFVILFNEKDEIITTEYLDIKPFLNDTIIKFKIFSNFID